ncbi:MAG: hypothetical protein HY718_04645 [Planctomycetes bacterium]|nr:hypothetical protein [Planctomycetota bacterium]
MPVRPLPKRPPSPEAPTLKNRLVREWRNKKSTAAQPIILQESGESSQPIRVYVIWDDWKEVSGIERSEIIMDAFEAVHGKRKALNVTVAMGLTSAEADRMGIHYQ